MKENLIKGANIGLILLVSSILTLRFTNDLQGAVKVFNYFIPVVLVYIVIGILSQFIRQLPCKESEVSMGVSIYYWVWMIVIIVPIIGMFIDDYIRYIILINGIVILGIWIVDYIHISKIAKELNGGRVNKHKTLVMDLDEKPKSKEEFFRLIEEKCIVNGDILEYIERDIPAIVKINKILYKIEIGYYYGIVGNIVYTLKISEL